MITIRRAPDRGSVNLGWLDSNYSFSFGHYYDPKHMGFASLRVINEDKIAPGRGFDMHGHSDMEIITYVLQGALKHQDSLGNGSVIRPGDVQRMSAGTGIRHSEYNASKTEPVHLLQIWIQPNEFGIAPSYEETHFDLDQTRNVCRLIGSNDARDGSVKIHQAIDLYAAVLEEGRSVDHSLQAGRVAWLQVARGSLLCNGEALTAGDGVAIEQAMALTLTGTSEEAEFLLFDMANQGEARGL
ncbi:MAG: pirin family protein [Oscillatoriales cyanobacterium]|nr:MAG: pirin family protein [Oscillatoriales cyanobacterium]